MENNQDNFNNNPQMNILRNLNNQNPIASNSTEPLNVIPNTSSMENNKNANHQFDADFIKIDHNSNNVNMNNGNNQVQKQNTFINNPINLNTNPMNNITNETNNNFEEENPMLNLNKNKFITTNEEVKDTSLNSMNVNGEYNNMPKVDYSTDPKVRENIEMINKHGAKNTIKIGSEGKVFLIIIAILLIFTFIMPTIYDAIRNAR
ncbi:MAG: hypothetical protein IJE89_00025 [Bacilli bacterium]|nr:hypothetical protein [Bacilli bacterium]